MKFRLVSQRGEARHGTITFLRSRSRSSDKEPPPEKRVKPDEVSTTLKTPLCMQYTIMGSIPHLTWDLVDRFLKVEQGSPVLVPFSDLHSIQDCFASSSSESHTSDVLRNFLAIGNKDFRPLVASMFDPLQPPKSGWNKRKEVSFWSTNGRRAVTVKEFSKTISHVLPDVVQCMTDIDTPPDSQSKRFLNSLETSICWLREFLEETSDSSQLPVLATITGGYNLQERLKSTRHLGKFYEKVSGYVFEGLDPSQFDNRNDTSGFSIIKENISELPDDRPRIWMGPVSPTSIYRLVNLGIDIFDSSYATQISEKGQALLPIAIDELCAQNHGDDQSSSQLIDLKDKCFEDDLTPISPSCSCYTCSKGFTRAYINHLLVCKEMLSLVLLNLHNLHVYYTLFEELRRAISTQ